MRSIPGASAASAGVCSGPAVRSPQPAAAVRGTGGRNRRWGKAERAQLEPGLAQRPGPAVKERPRERQVRRRPAVRPFPPRCLARGGVRDPSRDDAGKLAWLRRRGRLRSGAAAVAGKRQRMLAVLVQPLDQHGDASGRVRGGPGRLRALPPEQRFGRFIEALGGRLVLYREGSKQSGSPG